MIVLVYGPNVRFNLDKEGDKMLRLYFDRKLLALLRKEEAMKTENTKTMPAAQSAVRVFKKSASEDLKAGLKRLRAS